MTADVGAGHCHNKKLQPASQKTSTGVAKTTTMTTDAGAGHCQQQKAATVDEESYNRHRKKLQPATMESYGDDGEEATSVDEESYNRHHKKLQLAMKESYGDNGKAASAIDGELGERDTDGPRWAGGDSDARYSVSWGDTLLYPPFLFFSPVYVRNQGWE